MLKIIIYVLLKLMKMKRKIRCYKDVWLDYMFFKVFGCSYQRYKNICLNNWDSISYNIYCAYKYWYNNIAKDLFKLYFVN